MTPYGYISAASANQDSQNATVAGGSLEGFTLQNTHATLVRYVKMYNKQNPTSADTPFWRFALAPAGGGVSKAFKAPCVLSNGLSFRITGGPADNDATAVGAADVLIDLEVY